MYLFDSDILIDVLRGRPGALDFMLGFTRKKNFISVITYGEILMGMHPSEEPSTRVLLAGFTVLEADRHIAENALDIKIKAKGHKLELFDCFIAATAVTRSLTLVTKNIRHFPDKRLNVLVPDYE